MPGTEATVIAIAIMAAATYFTRFAGLWLVGCAPVTPGIERALHHLSGSVLAALVATAIVGRDGAAIVGVGGSVVAMIATRRPLPSLLFGTAVTALLRL